MIACTKLIIIHIKGGNLQKVKVFERGTIIMDSLWKKLTRLAMDFLHLTSKAKCLFDYMLFNGNNSQLIIQIDVIHKWAITHGTVDEMDKL